MTTQSSKTRDKILRLLARRATLTAAELAGALSISRQALHRHLRVMTAQGALERRGTPPLVRYALAKGADVPRANGTKSMQEVIRRVFAGNDQVLLVTLFGSQARGTAKDGSDIDLLVWVSPKRPLSRRAVWAYWDAATEGVPWADRASIIVKALTPTIELHTLLLDLPEEHLPILDRGHYFERLKGAVERWRKDHGAVKIPSFNDTHAWRYASGDVELAQLDFTLRIGDVA